MINEILGAWKDGKNPAAGQVHTCKYCQRGFKKEGTLASHQCEPKRRVQQEKEIGVQFGLQSYLKFYEMTQGSAKTKTYADFADSSFYLAFVKFGRYMVSIRAVNPRAFIEYVINNNKKLDKWCHEDVYLEYLRLYMRTEAVQDALERGILEIEKHVSDNPDLKNGMADYFRYGNSNRICHHIANGRISPWVVYNCDSGIEFLEKLSEEQIMMVIQWIDPDFWQRKFKEYRADTEWVKMILTETGL